MNGLDSIVAAIRQHEGFYPGSLSYRNNNPGNLRLAGQRGATPGDGGFARFPTYADGEAALAAQVRLDASRGFTLEGFLNKFAPSSENNTAAYIASVSRATGIAPGQSLSDAIAGSTGGDTTPPFSPSSARRSTSPHPEHPMPGHPLPLTTRKA